MQADGRKYREFLLSSLVYVAVNEIHTTRIIVASFPSCSWKPTCVDLACVPRLFFSFSSGFSLSYLSLSVCRLYRRCCPVPADWRHTGVHILNSVWTDIKSAIHYFLCKAHRRRFTFAESKWKKSQKKRSARVKFCFRPIPAPFSLHDPPTAIENVNKREHFSTHEHGIKQSFLYVRLTRKN